MSISSVFSVGSDLVLPGAAATRAYAVAQAEPSLTGAEKVPAAGSNMAARVTSPRYATRSLSIEDFSALVAEAEVRARTIELFGTGSNAASETASSNWVELSDESGLGGWPMSDSPAASPFAGIQNETDATDSSDSSLLTDPADENGDGFVSLTEELAYARTHSMESSLFESEGLW